LPEAGGLVSGVVIDGIRRPQKGRIGGGVRRGRGRSGGGGNASKKQGRNREKRENMAGAGHGGKIENAKLSDVGRQGREGKNACGEMVGEGAWAFYFLLSPGGL
jgi:hypothetical protein